MNISGIFTVKKAKRGSEFLNPENLKSMAVTMNYKRNIYISGNSTSFPGLSYEDEARHEKALVWAGHVTTQKMAVFDSYSSRSGEISFNEIYKSSKQISKQPKDFSIDIIYV